MSLARLLALAILVAVFAMPAMALAQTSTAQEMSDQDKKMMEMVARYGTPGKNHELLKKYVGDWDVDIKAWPKPEAEPMTSKGSAQTQLLFEGRFVKMQFEGMMEGKTFRGFEVIGYDLYQNKYVTFWIDDMSTSFVWTSGVLDASGKILTETGAWPDPMTEGKQMQKVKNVTTFLEDGKLKYEMFMVMPDGKEVKWMELLYTRKM